MRLFAVRLAPGVRLSATSRGVRAHVGPRAARLHVGGGGRTGVSTGAGPFTFYTSGGNAPAGRTTHYRGPTQAQINATAKEQQAELIRRCLDEISHLHLEQFAAAQRVEAAAPTVPTRDEILRAQRRRETKGIGFLRRRARAEAGERARLATDHEYRRLTQLAARAHEETQAWLDASWTALSRNDPDALRRVLTTAFADNEVPATVVDADRGSPTILVVVPDEDLIPDRQAGLTPAGNLSLKKMSKTAAATWYRELVAGSVLVTAKEVFAVAPGLESMRIAVVRDEGPTLLMVTRLSRDVLGRALWEGGSAWRDLLAMDPAPVMRLTKRTQALDRLDLSDYPDIESATMSAT